MKKVIIAGRCLFCWTLTWGEIEIERHLPAAFKLTCRGCNTEQLHATTGQLVPTLTPTAMREIKAAHKEQRSVRWEQLPMMLDLTGPDEALNVERAVDPIKALPPSKRQPT